MKPFLFLFRFRFFKTNRFSFYKTKRNHVRFYFRFRNANMSDDEVEFDNRKINVVG